MLRLLPALPSTLPDRMTYLSRDTILQREDIVTEDVEVPEWSGTVRVRGMSGVERDAFEASLIEQPVANGQRKRRNQTATKSNLANVQGQALRLVHRGRERGPDVHGCRRGGAWGQVCGGA